MSCLKYSKKLQMEEYSSSFYEVTIILTPTPKHIIEKGSYRTITPINIDQKLLSKMLAKRI